MGSIWVEEEVASAVNSSEEIGKLHEMLAMTKRTRACGLQYSP
jgi:hypothetical protein